MSRNLILILGAICWMGLAVDVAVHLATGNVVSPAAMAVVFAVWLVVRRSRFSPLRARA
jgi:hypothetical protein